MRLVHWLTAITIWLTAAAGLAAQTQITTGVIEGIVVARGAVLPGVDVGSAPNQPRALPDQTGGPLRRAALPPGRYTVTLKLSGFATVAGRRARECRRIRPADSDHEGCRESPRPSPSRPPQRCRQPARRRESPARRR